MEHNKRMKQVCECLRMIERTRLLCNTQEGLAELVGCSITSGNGLARKGGNSLFMKEAILRELAFIAKEKTGMNLEEVVEEYEEVDVLLEKYASHLKGKDVCNQLVRFFYGDGEVAEDMAGVFAKVERRLVPIIVLMLQGVLPRLSAKGGDVKDIKKDYQRVFAWLHQVTTVNIPIQTLPVLSQLEDIVHTDPSVMCRLHLIYLMETVLNVYGSMSTLEGISLTNRELQKDQVYPDVEGLWVENEATTEFWKIEGMTNAHSLCRYVWNSGKKKLTYEKYTIRFYDKGNFVMAIVTHPQTIQFILSGKPVPNGHHAYLECVWKDGQLDFQPLVDESQWFSLRHLQKSSHEDFFQQLLNNERYTKEDKFAAYAYQFSLSLAAITAEHLYIEAPEGGFYQVPKSLNPVLDDVQFGDNVGAIIFADSLYVAFDDKLLYYDVSTEEQMKQWNIKKVLSVSV